MGLGTNWTADTGLVISKLGTASEGEGETEKRGAENKTTETYTATVAAGKITVNGKAVDNEKEQYPLLVFRNATYFPLTWRFAVEEFGWDYSFIEEKGLVINSK